MASHKILVVDDDQAIRILVHRFLTNQEYQVESAEDGKTALILFKEFQPDLVVLDINLPDTTGFQLCQEMQSYNDVLVLMLSSLCDEVAKVRAFQLGADDYLTKPFSLVELNARLKAILKRQRLLSPRKLERLVFGDLVINNVEKEVRFQDKIVSLTNLQFNLLFCMANQPGYVWSRSELCDKVFKGEDSHWFGSAKVCDVHISQIRKKIKSCGCDFEYIKTIIKVGYKFEAPV
ncbi:MAG: response regulator transcription factor [Okeania sp. SIO2G4]|uniref:response regulator transcription factor n=1 Tax=unclassified Okeania TaxID=2634635 RepID=UPI0013BD2FFE|nr:MULTISPECIES: response regulator transcription factor [unclassified Okeania]NEP07739.1 response regulator transcription factor [Okeania sp. SIO4D6]NEP45226.1 response regulator transcription factor [Okeania sp. SIO2H7]NEP73679.1 response regulator transcription factor [Okeania sp. SIO2G5]NEP94502.1 response regulator transcription factor [Okeania sp. SIO2F5]NEQ92102.1 response regulator transcription factor [Okeania sp. SIO2G4]